MFVLNGCAIILFQTLITQKDYWISILLALILSIPLYLIYARLQNIYPGQDLYGMIANHLGKPAAKIVYFILLILFIILILFYLYSTVTFITITSLDMTPKIFLYLALGILVILASKAGVEVIGRIALMILPLFGISITLLIFGLMPQMNLNYIQPILTSGFAPVIKDALAILVAPLGSILELMVLADSFHFKKSPPTIYLVSIILSGIMIMAFFAIDVLVLGSNADKSLYPCYDALGRLIINDLIQRIEIIPLINLMLSSIIKLSIMLIGLLRIISRLFKLENFRSYATPVMLSLIALINLISINPSDLIKLQMILVVLLFPFRILLPLSIWLALEIKRLIKQKRFT